VFVCVGDPVTIGDYPHGSNDVDVTATGLLQLITEHFNTGVDRAGSPIGEPTAFFAGAAASPSAPDLEREVRLLRRKVAAGAGFVLTQPVYALEPLRVLREAYERLIGEPFDVPVIAGVLPLVSGRHAAFLQNEVPGSISWARSATGWRRPATMPTARGARAGRWPRTWWASSAARVAGHLQDAPVRPARRAADVWSIRSP
jgi:5,10-methylenetetrahydrofolate reductase